MPARGHRARFLAPLALAGFVLAAPMSVFVLGPLAALLLLSRPASWREWLWIVLSVSWLVVALRLPTTLAEQTLRAAGIFFTGAFVAASLAGVRSLFNRAAIGAALAATAVVAWFSVLGLQWSAFRSALVSSTWAAYRLLDPNLPDRIPDGSALMDTGGVAAYGADIARALVASADFFPGFMAVTAMAGGWLAWTWYHRVARHPIGAPPRPFREFRFWDHLIWLVVVAAAGVLFLPAGPGLLVAQNVLLVLVACYVVRGAAVVATASQKAPPLFVLMLCALVILLLNFALIGFAVVGVADTWLDPRRRMLPPEGVPL